MNHARDTAVRSASGGPSNPGLQVNPEVVELTVLSDELRKIWGRLCSGDSIPNQISAALEAHSREEGRADASAQWGWGDLTLTALGYQCCQLCLASEDWARTLVQRAESAITHKGLREQVISALRGIHQALTIPGIDTTTHHQPTGGSDLIVTFSGRREWIVDFLQACDQAAEQAAVLDALADQVYLLADHIRERDRDLAAVIRLSAAAPTLRNASKKKTGMTKTAANERAMQLARDDPKFIHRTQREWADEIGCAVGLISDLPFWREVARQTGRERKGKRPEAVALTEKVLARATDRDTELTRLMAEQNRDAKEQRVRKAV